MRINGELDSLPGLKTLHFYEGGLRELGLLADLLSERTDVVAIFNFFSLEPWHRILTSRQLGTNQMRSLLRDLILSMKRSVAFTCDSERMRDYFSEKLGVDLLSVYPLFSTIPFGRENEGWDKRTNTYLFAPRTLGEQRLVVKALELLAKKRSGQESAVVISRWNSSILGSVRKRLRELDFHVELIDSSLTSEDYAEVFLNTKVVVLPYLDKHYVFGSSGKTLDARMAGCLTVAPTGTSAGYLVSRMGWGTTFDGSASGLAASVYGLDLSTKPIFVDQPPSLIGTVTALARLSSTLTVPSRAPSPKSMLRLLPLAVFLLGSRWALIHGFAVPAKRAFERVCAIRRTS